MAQCPYGSGVWLWVCFILFSFVDIIMTDTQFLTSMRVRATQRLGNFHFLFMLDELITQAREVLSVDCFDRGLTEKRFICSIVAMCP